MATDPLPTPLSHSKSLPAHRFMAKRIRANTSSFQLNMNVATQSLALSEATSSASRFSSLASKLSKFKKQAGKASVVEEIKYDWMREGLDLGEMGGKATKVMRAAAMQVRELVPRMLLEELECWEVLEEACGKSKSRESLEEQICRKVESKTSESKASESKTSESKAKEEAEAEDAHEVRKDTEAEDAPDAWDASDAPNAPDAHSVLKNTYHARLTEFKSVVSVLKSARASNKPVDKVTPLCAEMLLNVKEQFGEDGAGLRREYEEAIEECKGARLVVVRSLREEHVKENVLTDETIVAMFDQSGFTECIEMEILREEVGGKFEELERQQEEALSDTQPQASNTATVTTETCASPAVLNGDEALKFEKIVRSWEGKAKMGGVKKVVERLKVELPDTPVAEFQAMLTARNSNKMRKQKTEDCKAQYKRKREAIAKWARKAFEQVESALVAKAEQDYVASIGEVMREEQMERLNKLRSERRVVREKEEERARKEKEIRDEEEKAQKEEWDKEHEEKKAEIEEWKEEERVRERKHREGLEREKEVEMEERERRMEENGERVEYRGIVRVEKMREKEHEMEMKRIREREMIERLNALAATVPYWDNVVNAKADLEKSTVARENDVYCEDLTGLYSFQQGDGKLRSFTNEKVFSDVRFRLGAALRAAGISGTAASGNVIRQMIPRASNPITGSGMR